MPLNFTVPAWRALAALASWAILVLPPTSHAAPAAPQEVVLHAMGDIMLAGTWAAELQRMGYAQTFAGVAAELARGDINVANLESPIARGGVEYTDKQFRFRADPAVAPALRAAGIHLVSLANNHSMDFGAAALRETREHLHAAGISWMGAGENLDLARRPVLMWVKGQRLAFLAYSAIEPAAFYAGPKRPGTAPAQEDLMLADVAAARAQADHVIVSLHWGTESLSSVQPYQRHLAHRLIDAGADILIGHHPHVLRGVERYRHGLVLYSLGNFVFATRGSQVQHSAIARLRLSPTQRSLELLPLDVHGARVGFAPQLLQGTASQAVVAQVNALSAPFNTRLASEGGRHTLAWSTPTQNPTPNTAQATAHALAPRPQAETLAR